MGANPPITIRPIHQTASKCKIAVSEYNLTEFQDIIDTKYNSVNAFGRSDPILNYQSTSRRIVVGIRVTTSGIAAPIIVAGKRMQYPTYENSPSNALNISRPPLVFFKMGTMFTAPNSDEGALLCAMNGFNYSPKTGFTPLDSPLVNFGGGVDEKGNAQELDFSEYSFKFDFTVLHPMTIGFQEGSSGEPSWIGGDNF